MGLKDIYELENYCEVCGRAGERHHVIFRSQSGIDFPLNYKNLCKEHHTGNNSPHKNKEIDLQYKKEMQILLEATLTNAYITKQDLLELEIKEQDADKVLKTLTMHPEGYERQYVIRALLGGRLYD